MNKKILKKLKFLYPYDYKFLNLELDKLIKQYSFKNKIKTQNKKFTNKDMVLICYADHIYSKNEKTLKTFSKFALKYFKEIFNRIHFLPFFPYSSDDGFSVIDYYKINQKYGTWKDINKISKDFKLMFDFVMNHISSESKWFKEFLKGNKKYENYFLNFEKSRDVKKVFRPRTSPLLSEFDTGFGKRYVWTTFSKDQIDINVAEPKVFLEVVKIFLFFLQKEAKAIRLDAIAFLWKELGTSCINLKETHEVIKILRLILEELNEDTWIITETNIPHKDNVSYFGNSDEADMVYNFSLPPLLIYSFFMKNSLALTKWAKNLEFKKNCTFFNFTASHDGIGLTPLKGIISQTKIEKLATFIKSKKGKVNYRNVPGKKPLPYELNIVYQDAFENEKAFLSSQAIQLSLRGVPGIYFNSIIGAHNDLKGVKEFGYNRAINREKFEYKRLCSMMNDNFVFQKYSELLKIRVNEPLFDPDVKQEVLQINSQIFVVKRFTKLDSIFCITNVSDKSVKLNLEKIMNSTKNFEIITNQNVNENFILNSYETAWIKKIKK